MTKLFIAHVRSAGAPRPLVTVRAEAEGEARLFLAAAYPDDEIVAVTEPADWVSDADTGSAAGDVREHPGSRGRRRRASPAEPAVPASPEDVRATALLLPEVVEGAHKGNPDFRVGGRVFATLWTEEERVVVRLAPEVQAALVEAEPDVFEPIPGSWGARGWTNVALADADDETLRDALLAAWTIVAPPDLVARYAPLLLDAPAR